MIDEQVLWNAAVPMTIGVVIVGISWTLGMTLAGAVSVLGPLFGVVVALGGLFVGCRYLAEGVSIVVRETVAEATASG